MELNQKIIEILEFFYKLKKPKILKYLKKENKGFKLFSGEKELFSVNPNSLTIINNIDISKKIIFKNSSRDNLQEEKLKNFLDAISKKIIRINHLGIGYNYLDPSQEIKKYISQIKKSKFKLYRETSTNKYVNWHYVGNLKTDIEAPIFEIVLTKCATKIDKWSPHFQIDIDTKLTSKELLKISKNIFGDFDWSMNLPNGDVILGMKLMGRINGVEICLGVSTQNRDFLYHRKKLIKEVKLNV